MPPSLLLWFYLCGNLMLGITVLGIVARLAGRVVVVRGLSMFPTLTDGDRLVVLHWWPRRLLRRGQIVLAHFSFTGNPGEHVQVKRIVATAGETITTALAEIPSQHMQCLLAKHHDALGWRTWHIPPQHVFLRGDNRAKSTDSLIVGPLPHTRIQGVVLMKLPRAFPLFAKRRA